MKTAPPAASRRPAGQQRLNANGNAQPAAAGRPPRGPAAASQGASRAAAGASAMDIDGGAGIEDSDEDDEVIPGRANGAARAAAAPGQASDCPAGQNVG